MVGLSVLIILLPSSPLHLPLPLRDSGVFLYIGWRILNGELPYLKIWDHKPPLIFYLNALGLALTNNSRWGVWLLEYVGVILAAWIGFKLIKRAMGSLPAIFSLAIWLSTLYFVIDGGNLPEEFALPIQFGCLWLIIDADKIEKDKRWHYYGIGLLTGLAFFLKQTAIGMGLAIVIFLIVQRLTSRRSKSLFQELLWMAGGVLSITVPIVIFFVVQGAFKEFWDAAFRYNLIYSASNLNFLSRLLPSTLGITPLATVGLFQLGLMGYVIGLFLLLSKISLTDEWKPLLIVCLIALPIELILISASGFRYTHYYMSLLPTLAVFAALFFWIVLLQLSHLGMQRIFQELITLAAIMVLVWSSFNDFRILFNEHSQERNDLAISYIETNTSSEDSVLLWGAESAINFQTKRQSPSRYVYQFPLYKVNFVKEKSVLEFLNDIIQNRPVLIINTNNNTTPIFDFPVQTESIQKAVNTIQAHYHQVDNLDGWMVYQYNNP